jgi:sodium/hydrogen exchanger 8
MVNHELIGINSFLVVVLILLCLLMGGIIKKYKFHYLPESGAYIFIGFVVGAFLNLTSNEEKQTLQFDGEVFFFVLLPPIIFEAGYTLKRKDFFANFGSISMFAVVGTVITALMFGYFLYFFAYFGLIPLDGSNPLECLLFGSLIAATDPVATLAILNSKEINPNPLLYSLIFGESVLNDAIAIVLFKTFEVFVAAQAEARDKNSHDIPSFTGITLLKCIGTFCGVALGSIAIGIFVALVCCFIFKRANFKQYPVYEFTLVTLFAYSSYFLGEISYTSGIMALFFCSVCLAHYNFYNISQNAQIATHEAFKSMAQICETFVFAYIGISAGLSMTRSYLQWHFGLIIVTIVGCLIARAFSIFPLSFIINLKRREKLPLKMQLSLWFAGLRGAVAFALAINYPGPSGPYVVTSTLMLVLFTTIVMGGFTLPVLRATGMAEEATEGNSILLSSSHGNETQDLLTHPDDRDKISVKTIVSNNNVEHFLVSRGQMSPTGISASSIDEGELLFDENGQVIRSLGRYELEAGSFNSTNKSSAQAAFNRKKYSPIVAKWKQFDKTFMRKWFGGHIPRVDENTELSNLHSSNDSDEDSKIHRVNLNNNSNSNGNSRPKAFQPPSPSMPPNFDSNTNTASASLNNLNSINSSNINLSLSPNSTNPRSAVRSPLHDNNSTNNNIRESKKSVSFAEGI